MAAVICSKEISEKLGGYFSTFGGNPVSCSMGMAVLDVIYNEKLVCSAKSVGKYHGAALKELKVIKFKVVLKSEFFGILLLSYRLSILNFWEISEVKG